MVIFKKVRFRNFMSSGNTWIEVALDENPSTMIIGDNGAGKSTINEAIYYACYGKSYRGVNLDKLVNRKNKKECEVQLWLDIDGKDVFVRRTMYPDNFEITVNGTLIPQTHKRKYQKMLDNLLGCDYINSSQLTFIGKGVHQPFMKMEAWKRRYFVESILGLLAFGKMSEITLARNNKQKSKIDELKLGLRSAKEHVRIKEAYVNDLKKLNQDTFDREIKALDARIGANMDKLSELGESIRELEAVPEPSQSERESVQDQYDSVRDKISSIKAELKLVNKSSGDRDTCSKCGQALTEEHLAGIEATKARLTSELDKLVEEESRIKELVGEHNQRLQDHRDRQRTIQELRNRMNALAEENSRLQSEKSSVGSNGNAEKQIESAENSVRELVEIQNKLAQKLDIEMAKHNELSIMSTIISDKGLKASIIAQIIPVLNSLVNQYLSKLGLFAVFHIDEGFNDSIRVMGFDEVPYASFSEGEKLRIDMAVLLAWREIAAMLGAFRTNLLFFDEIFDSSLDLSGAEALSNVLNELGDANVFVITHTPEKIADRVDSMIKVNKVDGYTVIQKV